MLTPGQTADAEATVRRYRQLGDTIAELEAERLALRKRFEALVPVGAGVVVDDKLASVALPTRSFDLLAATDLAVMLGLPVRQVLTTDVSDLRDRLKAVGRLDDAMVVKAGAAPRVVMG